MSASESEGPLTVPQADAYVRAEKKMRKSARGRKLMKWGPDVDQQLLLAIEAAIIEGQVRIDWNVVGEKLYKKVTGEAVKQHFAKLRESRESALMETPAKAVGKSVFGSRRGVVRHAPVDPNAPATPSARKKPIRPEPESDDDDISSDGEPQSDKIKNPSLLWPPAIPRKEKVSSKRKAEDEDEADADDEYVPEPPKKRARGGKQISKPTVKDTPEPVIKKEKKMSTPRPTGGGRKKKMAAGAHGSNFRESLETQAERDEKQKSLSVGLSNSQQSEPTKADTSSTAAVVGVEPEKPIGKEMQIPVIKPKSFAINNSVPLMDYDQLEPSKVDTGSMVAATEPEMPNVAQSIEPVNTFNSFGSLNTTYNRNDMFGDFGDYDFNAPIPLNNFQQFGSAPRRMTQAEYEANVRADYQMEDGDEFELMQ